MSSSMFDHGLTRRDANYEALTPVDFIARAAEVYGHRLAVVHGTVRRTWAQTYERAQRLANALSQAGIRRGDTVVTSGGIIGKVAKVDEQELQVEIADGVKIKVVRSTVSEVRGKVEAAPAAKAKASS